VGSRVVGLEGGACGRLFVAHFFKGRDDGHGFLCIEEEPAGFGLGRGGRALFEALRVLQRMWMAPLGLGVGGLVPV
jgi:hypothetical protein